MNCLVITEANHNKTDFPKSWVETIFLEEDRVYDFESMMELVSHVFDDCDIWHYKGQDWLENEDILFNPLYNSQLIRCAELNEGLEGLDNFIR